MARGRATDVVVRNQVTKKGISQLQINQKFHLAQSTICGIIIRFTTTEKSALKKLLIGN